MKMPTFFIILSIFFVQTRFHDTKIVISSYYIVGRKRKSYSSLFIIYTWQSFSLRSRKHRKTAQKALGKARKSGAEGEGLKRISGVGSPDHFLVSELRHKIYQNDQENRPHDLLFHLMSGDLTCLLQHVILQQTVVLYHLITTFLPLKMYIPEVVGYYLTCDLLTYTILLLYDFRN